MKGEYYRVVARLGLTNKSRRESSGAEPVAGPSKAERNCRLSLLPLAGGYLEPHRICTRYSSLLSQLLYVSTRSSLSAAPHATHSLRQPAAGTDSRKVQDDTIYSLNNSHYELVH